MNDETIDKTEIESKTGTGNKIQTETAEKSKTGDPKTDEPAESQPAEEPEFEKSQLIDTDNIKSYILFFILLLSAVAYGLINGKKK